MNYLNHSDPSSAFDPFYQVAFEMLEDILQSTREPQDLCKVAGEHLRALSGAEKVVIFRCRELPETLHDCLLCAEPSAPAELNENSTLHSQLQDILKLESVTVCHFPMAGNPSLETCGVPLISADGEVLGALLLLGVPEAQDSATLMERRLVFLARYFSEVLHNALVRQKQNELIAERTGALWQEIEERKSVEQVLRQSRDEWEETFNALPDLVTLLDPELTIVKVNQLTCEVFNLEPSSILGRKCHEVFVGSEEMCSACPVEESVEDKFSHHHVIENRKIGRTFLVNTAPIFDENGDIKHIVHAAKDITEQKRLEEELVQSQKMEAVGTLAGGIAHDFNNILSAIIGYSEIIKMGLPQDSALLEDANEVIVAGKRAADLVKQILAFSRNDHAIVEIFEPHLVIAESLKMLRSSLPTSVEIAGEIRKDCGYIRASPTSIHQIMMNLCTNALHAMENEKGILTVNLRRVELEPEFIQDIEARPGPYVLLSVADTGHGIAKEVRERIFEPYFTTKEIGRGTGLGLAMVHGIVHDAGGFVRVDSTEGQGSRFDLYLPVEKMESDTENASLQEDIPTGSEHILIVDDENAVTQVNRALLENLGYQTTTEGDSLRALEIIQAAPERFDLLLTDQTMPGLTGSELAKAALEIRPEMPIILCTGYSSVINEEEALALGIRKYLLKPVGREVLARSVRNALDA